MLYPERLQSWHHTPQEAHKVVVTDIDFLKGYLSDAVAATIAYLSEVNEDSLDDVVDDVHGALDEASDGVPSLTMLLCIQVRQSMLAAC